MKNNLTLVDKLNHIKNLFIIGKSDGNLNEKEIQIISDIAKYHELSAKDVSYILNENTKFDFTLPKTFTDRLSLLYDAVLLMVVDLNIHQNEKAICIDLAKKLQPKVVIAENVKGLLLGEAKNYVREIYREFDLAGYYVQHWLLDASKMGVPQKRERVFFIAMRKDIATPFLKSIDLVLIMSVEPGFGGQSFIEESLDKIKKLKEIIVSNNYDTLIEVDGGINDETGLLCKKAGADVLVAGSYIFNGDIVSAVDSLC